MVIRYIKVLTLIVFAVLIALFLRWCSTLPVGGYCVVDTNASVIKEINGQTVIEKGYKVCYDAEGNIKED